MRNYNAHPSGKAVYQAIVKATFQAIVEKSWVKDPKGNILQITFSDLNHRTHDKTVQ